MKPRVAVVILNYNTCGLLKQFIPSALSSGYENFELVVADNASTDGSAEWVKENHPQVTLITLPENYGYAGGYNKVLDQVSADYFVLLNSDVEVTPGWIDPVITLMEKMPAVAACQPKIKWHAQRNSFEYAGASGGYIDRYGYPFCRGRLFDTVEEDHGQYDDPAEIFWASGACLFIRSDVWKKSGGLDPDFFAHMEEIDLCWRIKNMGYEVMVCPQSHVYHIGGGTLSQQSAKKTYLNFRNGLSLLAKNLPSGRLPGIIITRLLLDHIAAYRFLLSGKSADFKAVAKAHYHFLRKLRYWLNKRQAQPEGGKKLHGIYPGSIVLQYFVKKKKHFSDLEWKAGS